MLANEKTRKETGLSYVMQSVYIATPFGGKLIKALTPFIPGQEESLNKEFLRMEQISALINQHPKTADILYECFMEVKDCTFTVERSGKAILSVVELFELKTLLILMEKIRKVLLEHKENIPEEFFLADIATALDVLDPAKQRMNTFYIYDEFSEKLGPLRKQKRELEVAIRKEQKKTKLYLEEKYGLEISPKFEYVVSKSTMHLLNTISQIPELCVKDEDYMNTTFQIKPTGDVCDWMQKIDELDQAMEEEEILVRSRLSEEISAHKEDILRNCEKIGWLDFTMGKVDYAQKHRCIKPTIVPEHIMEFVEGRHLEVEDILISKGKDYCPVSISLADGVTCITGANMGGKTVSLKLTGLIQLLAQYGFYVPCSQARIGLCNFIQILIGDSQSVERGLSSFGSEMEELKEILDKSTFRSLLLIDEIASGTNPIEGLALTKSIIYYLKEKPYITLITTHFDDVAGRNKAKNMQVIGLEHADFERLDKEIKYANRKERINIISKYMDYRLKLVESGEEIPKDALNIAKILGLNSEIINKAKGYLQ